MRCSGQHEHVLHSSSWDARVCEGTWHSASHTQWPSRCVHSVHDVVISRRFSQALDYINLPTFVFHSEILEASDLQDVLSTTLTSRDGEGWQVAFVNRYSVLIKARGVIMSKGYMLRAERDAKRRKWRPHNDKLNNWLAIWSTFQCWYWSISSWHCSWNFVVLSITLLSMSQPSELYFRYFLRFASHNPRHGFVGVSEA